jgi:uncharacterized protein involved in exopolysaccharide biosynthesis
MDRVTPEQLKLENGPAAFPSRYRREEDSNPALNIHLLESLQRHTLLALFVFLFTAAAGFLYLHVRYGKSYLAQALVYVSPTYPRTLNADQETDHTQQYDSFIDQQVHSITRPDILINAIRKMPVGIWRLPHESEQAAAQRLANALEVERVATTYQVSIGLHSRSPNHLAEIVNAVARAYVETSHNEEYFGHEQRLQGLRDERDHVQSDLDTRLGDQAALLKDLGLASISNLTINPHNARLAKLNDDLLTAREQRQAAESQLSALHDNGIRGTSAITAEAQDLVQSDQGLNALKITLNQRRGKLLSDISGMTPENPVRRKDEEEMREIDASLRKMTSDMTSEAESRLEQKYRSQVIRTRTFEQDIENQIATESEAAADSTPRFQAALEMNADIDRLNLRLAQVKDRIANVEIENTSPGSVHLFSAALTPIGPDSAKEKTLLLVLFPLCFCLAIAAVVARDTFDMRVFTAEDIEKTIGLPPIGVLFNRDEVTDEVSSEYLFRIAASLDHARRTAEIKTIAVTSVKPRGGTSSMVDLLAAELAQLGNRVLVLDAGGTREPIAFIPPEQDGLNSNPRARTLHPELGPYLHSRGRLLPSVHTITRSFRETHGEYDVLLLDCQPIFVSADTEYLARMADATLLVVESGMVLKQDLLRAAHLLERLPVPSVAVVLNQLSLDRADLSLREDLREFVTYGRGFAHGKPIPLTTTRHQDYPVAPPGSYESADEAGEPISEESPIAHEPPFPPYHAPEAAPPIAEAPPAHEQSADVEEDRSEGRKDDYDGEDEHT